MSKNMTLLAAALSFTLASTVAYTQTRPNILFIMTDDQDAQSLAYMPKLKALLMDQGVTFTNAFAQFPLCCPSRAAILSGQFSHNNGVRGNSPSWNGSYSAWKPSEGNSLAPWMQSSGYYTGFIGKNLNQYELEAWHIPPGWSKWRSMKTVNYNNWTFYGGDGTIKQGPEYVTDDQKTRTVTMMQDSVEPFMNFVWAFAPHVNTNTYTAVPAARHLGMYDNVPMPRSPAFNSNHMTGKHPLIAAVPQMNSAQVLDAQENWQRYIETLQAVDDLVENAVNYLTSTGQINNTYIIYSSDNGNLHGEWKRTGKLVPYERSVSIPLIIRGPGVPAGVKRNELVLDTDITATILDLGNAAYGRVLDGRSLVPLLSTAPVAWRSAIFMTGLYDGAQVYETNFTRWNAVRTQTHKYIKASDGFEELYDLYADPNERFNVINDPYYAGYRNYLRTLETKFKTCAGTTCWVQ